jgi:hypothetical protein
MYARPAPRAARTANSRSRASPIETMRPPTLASDSKRKSVVAPNSRRRGGRAGPTSVSVRDRADIPQPSFELGCARAR